MGDVPQKLNVIQRLLPNVILITIQFYIYSPTNFYNSIRNPLGIISLHFYNE